MYIPRIVEAAIAAVVVAVLALVIAFQIDAGKVLFPCGGALAVFIAVLLRKGADRRPPARRRTATKTAKS